MNYSEFSSALSLLLGIVIISVPLGLWKLVEIIIWVFSHIKWI